MSLTVNFSSLGIGVAAQATIPDPHQTLSFSPAGANAYSTNFDGLPTVTGYGVYSITTISIALNGNVFDTLSYQLGAAAGSFTATLYDAGGAVIAASGPGGYTGAFAFYNAQTIGVNGSNIHHVTFTSDTGSRLFTLDSITFSLSAPPLPVVFVTTPGATEVGPDTFSASAKVLNQVLTSVAASESSQDTFSASGNFHSVATATASGLSSLGPLPPLKIDPVDKFIFDGIQSRFLEVFDAPTVWTTSTDKVRALDRLFPAKQAQSVAYPYAFLKISGWELATDRRNLRDSALRGIPVTTSDDGKSYLAATFLPVNFSVTVEFITNDFRSVLEFARQWMIASKTGRLSFQVEYGLTTLNIPLLLDTNVTFPQREGTPEDIPEYLAEVTFSALGYVSDPTVVQVGMVDSLEVSAALGPQPGTSVVSESIWSLTTSGPSNV